MTHVTVLLFASVARAVDPADRTSSSDSASSTVADHDVSGVWTIVVGGGSGQRFGAPKQYESLGDGRVIDRSRQTAAGCSQGVVVVVPEADAVREGAVAGGPTRSASVRAGLAYVPFDAEIICVHDAARPLASVDLYRRVVAAVRAGADAAIPGVAVTDTIKVITPMVTIDGKVDREELGEHVGEAAGDVMGVVMGVVSSTLDRTQLVAVQTPQAFRADRLRAAHEAAGDATDDAGLVEAAGGRVVVVVGDPSNRKITEPDDLVWARRQVAVIDVAGVPQADEGASS
jgi:2-C-methyl-D-erythritol 4-phosphate cytidylyltransferase